MDDIVYSGQVAIERKQWGEFWALGLDAEEIRGTSDPPVREFRIRAIPEAKVDALREVCVIWPSLEVGLRL